MESYWPSFNADRDMREFRERRAALDLARAQVEAVEAQQLKIDATGDFLGDVDRVGDIMRGQILETPFPSPES